MGPQNGWLKMAKSYENGWFGGTTIFGTPPVEFLGHPLKPLNSGCLKPKKQGDEARKPCFFGDQKVGIRITLLDYLAEQGEIWRWIFGVTRCRGYLSFFHILQRGGFFKRMVPSFRRETQESVDQVLFMEKIFPVTWEAVGMVCQTIDEIFIEISTA